MEWSNNDGIPYAPCLHQLQMIKDFGDSVCVCVFQYNTLYNKLFGRTVLYMCIEYFII